MAAARSGHFRLESGHHTERWLDLEQLFIEPMRLRPFVNELASKLAAHQPEVVCGPMTGGALLAELIADRLDLRFAFAERTILDGRPHYAIPVAVGEMVRGHRVAVIDDAISAGSAVRATLAEARKLGASVVGLGALILVSDRARSLARDERLPIEWLVEVTGSLWHPGECPLCRGAVPLTLP